MPDPSNKADWLKRIPGWLKAVWASIVALAAAIVAFQDNWRYYLMAAVVVLPAYLLAASIYLLVARRRTRSKTTPWTYRYGKRRYLGLVGLALVGLLILLPFISSPARLAGRDLFLGTAIPTATRTPSLTPSPVPSLTPTFTPTPPQLGTPDVLIAPFDAPPSAEHKVEKWLQDSLQQQLDEFNLDNVSVQVAAAPIRSEPEAQEAANRSGGKIVIWGWYDPGGIQVRVFLSGGGERGTFLPGTGIIPLSSVGEPESTLSVVISEVLPQNVTFLSLFVIGHLEYLSNNYQVGHRAFDAAMEQIPAEDKVKIENMAIVDFFRARKLDRDKAPPQEVVCAYVRAIEQDPALDVAYNNLGLVISRLIASREISSAGPFDCLKQIGYDEIIIEIPALLFRRAAEINPQLTLARYNEIAYRWLNTSGYEDPQGIRREIEAIQQQDPSLLGTYILLAVMDDREGDPAAAIQRYQAGIAVDPGIPLMHVNLGQLYLSYENNLAQAESEFLEALQLEPGHGQAALALAHLYYRQGRTDDALNRLDAMLAAEPESYEAAFLHRDALILRSSIAYGGNRPAAALDDLLRAEDKPFTDDLMEFLIGMLYQEQGQVEPAAAYYDKALQGETSAIGGHALWKRFKELCFTEETASMPFADWALTRLPASSCLPSDPHERILAVYALFNEQLYGLRERPQMIIMGAQCPFVYSEDPLTGEWQYETTILYKLVDREAAQVRPLSQFNGRLLIRELEPEITYLNQLYVIGELQDGSLLRLQPGLAALQTADRDYIVLRPGEEIVVPFDPAQGAVVRWWVMAVGYYTPLTR